MQSQIPLWLQKASEEALHGVSGRELERDYQRLSAGYKFGKPGEARTAWLAYLAARLPATYAAISAVLSQIPKPLLEPCQSLLDLGCGPGTGIWALAALLPHLKNAQGLDQDEAALELAGRLASAAPLRPTFRRADLQSGALQAEESDIVLASYLANEFEAEKRAQLFDAAWAKARRLLIWIEPGTPAGFEVILDLRAKFAGHVVAPCTQSLACPLAGAPREKWCHFSQRLERSRLSKLAKPAELGYEDEKFSYLVLSRQPLPLSGKRVLNYPKKREGQVQLELCGPEGLSQLKLSKKDKPLYKAARKAEWGDLWEQP